MDSVIIVLVSLCTIYLAVFWYFNHILGLTLFIGCLPFLSLSIYTRKNFVRIQKELVQVRVIFKKQKAALETTMSKSRHILEQQTQQIERFSENLSAAMSKDELLHLIVDLFLKVTSSRMGQSKCFLLTHDPVVNEFCYEFGANFDRNNLSMMRFSAKDGLLGNVFVTKTIYTYISDIFSADSQIMYFLNKDQDVYASGLGSIALLPLTLENRVWGIVVVFCHEHIASRIKKENTFFRVLLAQASIALGNAIHRGLASVDKLTQLYNRVFLQKRMQEEMEFCRRQLLPLSVLMIDIDNFKEINDSYGHQEGDIVLKKIAQILNKGVRLTDICARYGGDEFVVVLPGMFESAHDPLSIGERLRAAVELEDFIISDSNHIKSTVSIGIMAVKYPENKELNSDELMKKADVMLYKAKQEGKNKVCYFVDV
ncbi:MAG: hypothetical protein DRP78_01045 [Candidatus Omnitrophota bacterium]|nr:MAG: hypothetical protein DRP78_01045 [Candidatus Omnitrophota bacterium]